jgi:hypothetical protein
MFNLALKSLRFCDHNAFGWGKEEGRLFGGGALLFTLFGVFASIIQLWCFRQGAGPL